MNTEFYVGWIDNWDLPFQRKNTTIIAKALDKILSMNASVNMYMFEGGTNFGYYNGKYFLLLVMMIYFRVFQSLFQNSCEYIQDQMLRSPCFSYRIFQG